MIERETSTVSLRASSLVAARVVAIAEIRAGWTTDGVYGIYQQAYTDEPVYVSLYQIKQVGGIGDNGTQFPGAVDVDRE